MGYTFMAVCASRDLTLAVPGQRPDGHAYSLPMSVCGAWAGKRCGHLPGWRRFYERAPDHRKDRAPREVDYRRLRRHDHIRFRGSLGLHGVLAALGGAFIVSRRNHFTNTGKLAHH